jgi:hypothetical protein
MFEKELSFCMFVPFRCVTIPKSRPKFPPTSTNYLSAAVPAVELHRMKDRYNSQGVTRIDG